MIFKSPVIYLFAVS